MTGQENGEPTLITCSSGAGLVFMTGQPLEYHYANEEPMAVVLPGRGITPLPGAFFMLNHGAASATVPLTPGQNPIEHRGESDALSPIIEYIIYQNHPECLSRSAGMKKITWAAILCVAVGALFITGCFSLVFSPKPSTPGHAKSESTAGPVKGETASITGHLEKNKNQYVLTDPKSGVSYRLVGLKKAEEAQLSRYVGKTVTVRLVVKSTESAKAHIAQLVAILD
jgi:hypothetical protein